LVTHESTRTFTPVRFLERCNFLSKRDPPKSRIGTDCPFGLSSSASTLPPTFLFLQYSIVKDQTQRTQCLGPVHLRLRARSSVAHAALLIWHQQGRTLEPPAARRPRCGAYIGGAPSPCQHRFRSFLNFLRRPFGPRRFRPLIPAREVVRRHPRVSLSAVPPIWCALFCIPVSYSRLAGSCLILRFAGPVSDTASGGGETPYPHPPYSNATASCCGGCACHRHPPVILRPNFRHRPEALICSAMGDIRRHSLTWAAMMGKCHGT
jgi:hypothetical protein